MVKENLLIDRSQRGLTLVELLVGVLLQALVLLILVQLYLSGGSSLRMQQEVGKVQSRGQYAVSLLANDLRAAGYLGCRNLEEPSFEMRVQASGVEVMTAIADTIDVMKSGSGWPVPEGFSHAPNTDVLRAIYATGGAYLVDDVDHDTGQIEIEGAVALFGDNDLLLLSDCKTAHLFRATEVSLAAQTLTISYEGDLRDGDYLEGTPLLKLMDVTWFVASTTDNDKPGLYRQANGMAPVLVASSLEAFEVELVEGSKSSSIRYEMELVTERQMANATGVEGDHKVRREFRGYFNLRNFGA